LHYAAQFGLESCVKVRRLFMHPKPILIYMHIMKQYRYMLYPLTLCQRVHFSMLTFTIIRPVHRLFHTAKTRRTSTSGPLIIGLESGVNGELASCLRTGLTVACAFPCQTTLCPPAEPDDPTISLRIIKNVVFLASYSPKMFSDS